MYERERHQLERDVDRDQVVARRHEEHPDAREEQQRVVLPSRIRRRADEPHGGEDRQDERQQDERLEEQGEVVDHEGAAEDRDACAPACADTNTRRTPVTSDRSGPRGRRGTPRAPCRRPTEMPSISSPAAVRKSSGESRIQSAGANANFMARGGLGCAGGAFSAIAGRLGGRAADGLHDLLGGPAQHVEDRLRDRGRSRGPG